MRRSAALALLALASLAGCGGTDEETPIACLERPGIFLHPRQSPVPISDCLAENQRGGDLATVGASMVAAATRLNAAARTRPGGGAARRLGYLLGAAARGAEQTEGIHADLLRRLESAAQHGPSGGTAASAAFQRAYERGYAAGLARG